MLYPQFNTYRSRWECPEFWKFKADPGKIGEKERWFLDFDSNVEIAVPGSWNEQLEELALGNYVGTAWCSCSLYVPQEPDGRRYWLRVGSADYRAKVWVNGKEVGQHQGGFLPFEFEISAAVLPGATNRLTMLVNNELSAETIPQGIFAEDYEREDRLREETFPPARFDFFPYGGIHRPVIVYSTPTAYIEGVRVDTFVQSATTGMVHVRVAAKHAEGLNVRCLVEHAKSEGPHEVSIKDGVAQLSVKIEPCRFWSPSDPHMYLLGITLLRDNRIVDAYEMNIGVRQVSVVDGKLLLNGNPVYLKGFGRHEDFPVLGKAYSAPLVVKDFGLMKWINANSFRTSHYPYSEETMAMADRQGFLVIDEVPAVSLDLRYANSKTLTAHKQAVGDLIERDYNHPSVIMWALGNEPNLVGDEGYYRGSGAEYWKEVFTFARSHDASRPMTVPNCTRAGANDPVFEFSDILAINRYYGWYEFPGRIERGIAVLDREMEALHKKYGKPIFMTEFGADTIPGLHSTGDQMFTEEYQEKFLEQYINLLRSKKYVIGEHVWNFADFRTPQHFRRVLLNMKGVFTRTRQPKAAAFKLRRLWESSPSSH
jgi:beta-glucuronidase